MSKYFYRALLLGALILSCARTEAAAEPARQNVIVIMADDVGYECFGCYGSNQYATPRLDALAGEGIRFTHAYSQPLCTPSRVQIMTGQYNVRNYRCFGILDPGERTFGHLFQDAGYATAVAGKWQLFGSQVAAPLKGKGMDPHQAGFDETCLWQVSQRPLRFWDPGLRINGELKTFSENTYGPDICTDFLVDFIERHQEKPFFIYYPMILVHSPFLPTPDSTDRRSKNAQQNFNDMVAYMDKLVGRLVDKLDALGLRENTLVLFTGDNGTHPSLKSSMKDGRIIQGGKGKMTDAGTRVALIASQPGRIPAGQVCEDLVDFSDILPTVTDWCSVPHPLPQLDGHSFGAQLQGKPGSPREWVYCFYCPRPEKSPERQFARDQQWKLYRDGTLFNVADDVLEQRPVTGGGKDAKVARAKLQAALETYPAEGQSLIRIKPTRNNKTKKKPTP